MGTEWEDYVKASRDERAWEAVLENMSDQERGDIGVSFDLKGGEPFLRASFMINGHSYGAPLSLSVIREWAAVLTRAGDLIEEQFGPDADSAMRQYLGE